MLGGLRRLVRRTTSEAPDASGRWFSRDEAIMGTAIHVELWGNDGVAASAAIDAVMREMHRIDALMSPYKESSELSCINRDAARHPVGVCAELFDLLERSIGFSELSGGAFDITYASVGHLYDYRRRIRPTDDAAGGRPLRRSATEPPLDRAARTVRFARDGMRIDLGGFAKGHAVDNGAAILARLGVRHAVVDRRRRQPHAGRPLRPAVDHRHPRSAAR